MDTLNKIHGYNPWWVNGKVPSQLTKSYKRKLLFETFDLLKTKQIIVLSGMRGVGKKSLIFQLIDMLIKRKVKPDNIFFCNLYQNDSNIAEIAREFFTERLKIEIHNIDQSVYFFINNAQYRKNILDEAIEIISQNKYIKFILSYSNKVDLFSKYPGVFQDLVKTINIYPLTYKECLDSQKIGISGLQFHLNDILDFDFFKSRKKDFLRIENKIKAAYNKYISTTALPDFIDLDNTFVRMNEIKTKILDKIIYKDMHMLYDVKFPYQMDILFNFLCETSSKVSNQLDMSKKYKISYPSLLNYLKYYQNCLLITDSRNYYMGSKNEKRTNRKFFVSDISFMDDQDIHSINRIRTLVFNHCYKIARKRGWEIFYWQHDRVSIDIFLDIKQMIIPIDIKYQDNPVEQKDLKGVTKFLEKYKYERGVIITKNEFDVKKYDKCEVMLLPFWVFLLSEE